MDLSQEAGRQIRPCVPFWFFPFWICSLGEVTYPNELSLLIFHKGSDNLVTVLLLRFNEKTHKKLMVVPDVEEVFSDDFIVIIGNTSYF
jgi:hypothetical protein